MPLFKAIQEYINSELISIEQAIALNIDQSITLDSEGIRELIAAGRITVQEAIALNIDQLRTLNKGYSPRSMFVRYYSHSNR